MKCRKIVIKTALCILFLLLGTLAFSDEEIGAIETGEVLRLGAIDGVPFALIKEERDGLLSTVSEYYLLYGKEKAGPYDVTDQAPFHYIFSPDSKTLACNYSRQEGGSYLIVGKEKLGPYSSIYSCRFSPDSKVLGFSAIEDDYCDKVYLDGTVYTGSICGDKIIYLKDNKIMMR